jgi:transposase
MIAVPPEVYIATAPIDLRQSFDRLCAIVREQFGTEPRADAVFVFHNRHRTHLKILARDETGWWILYKRLDRGTFRIPLPVPPDATRVRADRRELLLLLEGIDRVKLRAARASLRSSR